MSNGACPTCHETLKPGAVFCPRCGRKTASSHLGGGDDEAVRRRLVKRREVIVGWFLLPAGLILMVAPFVVAHAGVKMWLGCGFGGLLAVIGLGCLVGEESPSKKKKKKKEKKKWKGKGSRDEES